MRLPSVWLTCLLFCAPVAFAAESWPGTAPIRLQVPGTPGGLIDVVPRALANDLAASIGVPLVVENRPGGGGNIAAGAVAKAAPDGHTLLVASTNLAVNPTLLPNPGFDYARDLAPVSMLAAAKLLLVAAPAFPAHSLAEAMAIARQKPKSVSIGVPAIGTPNELAAEMLAQYGDVDLTFVPYDGIAQAIPDVVAGRVDLTVGAVSTMLPFVRGRTLNALAVISPTRSPLAAEIPTTAEAGLAKLQIDNWICVMATGGTPAPIVARLDQTIAKVLALPRIRDGFAKQGVDIFYMGPQQLGRFIQAEAARYQSLLEHSRTKATSR